MKNIWIWLLVFALIAPVYAQTQPFTGYLYSRGFQSYLGATSTQDFMRGYLEGVIKFRVDKDGNITCGTVNGVDVTALGGPYTFTAPLAEAGHVVSIPAAASGVSGYLTAADWATFNAKAPTANPTFTGTATIGSGRLLWDVGASRLNCLDNFGVIGTFTAAGNVALGLPGTYIILNGTINSDVTVSAGKTIDGVDVGTLPGLINAKAGKPGQVVTVGASGCDYTTIGAALTAITDAASDKRYTVLIYPGEYNELVTQKDYVSLAGVNRDSCIINGQIVGSDKWGIGAANHVSISTLTVTAPTGGYAVFTDSVEDVLIENVTLSGDAWAMVGNDAEDIIVQNSALNASNPVNFLECDGVTVVHCTGEYSGTGYATACQGAIDLNACWNCYIGHNDFRITVTDQASGYGAYGVALGPQWGNVIEYNTITVTSSRSGSGVIVAGVRQWFNDGAPASHGGSILNIVRGNTINLHCTGAQVKYAANVMFDYYSHYGTPDWLFENNRIRVTTDATPSVGAYGLLASVGIAPEFLVPQAFADRVPTVTIDGQSIAADVLREHLLNGVTLVEAEQQTLAVLGDGAIGGDLTVEGTVTADALVYGTTDVETELGGKADASHSHAQSDITNLTTDLAAKVSDTGDTMTGALTVSLAAGGAATDGVVIANPTASTGQWSPQLKLSANYNTTAVQATQRINAGSSRYGTYYSIWMKYGAGADTEVFKLRADGLLASTLEQMKDTATTRIYAYRLQPQAGAASSGVPVRYSPSIRLIAHAWKSDATAASQPNTWDITAMAIAGAARTYPVLTFTSGSNIATPNTDRFSIGEDSIRIHTARTIASSSDAGNAGEMCWDANYLYVCVSSGSWRRIAWTDSSW